MAGLIPLFRAGLGGRIASGKQGFSWIHIQDLLNAIDFLMQVPASSGIYNLTSPHPVDNRTFTLLLAKTLRKPAILPVPAFVLKMVYGKGAITLVEGQTVYPEKLMEAGFRFKFDELEKALSDLLAPPKTW